jgi:hypothetical protein
MKSYTPSTPRFALAFGAVAMMAITLAVSVILPMRTEPTSGEPRVLAAATSSPPGTLHVATVAGIRVVGAREPAFSTIAARVGEAAPQSGRPGKAHSPAAAPNPN